MRRVVPIVAVAVLGIVGRPTGSFADVPQPAILNLLQIDQNRYEVMWRVPFYLGASHPAKVQWPDGWTTVVAPTVRWLSDSQVFRSVVSAGAEGVEGSVIRFVGLERTTTDVYVKLDRLDGTSTAAVARPLKPWARLRGERPWFVTAGEFITVGFQHILQGFDHLLFVLGLLLIVTRRVTLFKTITAFTVAHSITLAAATLGHARVPIPPVDAAIALSILFLGPEVVRFRRGETSLTIRYPWGVAFVFGLLHGFGFAGGLSTAGMPRAELPLALLFFNVGVELGQMLFVATALAIARSLKLFKLEWPRWAAAVPGYAVGCLGAFWTIQRTVILLLR